MSELPRKIGYSSVEDWMGPHRQMYAFQYLVVGGDNSPLCNETVPCYDFFFTKQLNGFDVRSKHVQLSMKF